MNSFTGQLQLQLHKHLNKNSSPLNQLNSLLRRGQPVRSRGLSGIDFVQSNHGKYQVLPQTIWSRNI